MWGFCYLQWVSIGVRGKLKVKKGRKERREKGGSKKGNFEENEEGAYSDDIGEWQALFGRR